MEEYKLGDHVAGTKLATQVAVLSNTVEGGQRTVVLSRPFAGVSPQHYSFNASAVAGGSASLTVMDAVGAPVRSGLF